MRQAIAVDKDWAIIGLTRWSHVCSSLECVISLGDSRALFFASGIEVKLSSTMSADQDQSNSIVKLFSYGSNSSAQLQQRTGAAAHAVSGCLKDYTRIFAGNSQRWKGAVASVYAKLGAKTYGAVMELTVAQIEVLDGCEWGYTRTLLPVTVADGSVLCWVYSIDDTTFEDPPSQQYLQAIRKMLDEVRSIGVAPQRLVIRTVQDGKICVIGHERQMAAMCSKLCTLLSVWSLIDSCHHAQHLTAATSCFF